MRVLLISTYELGHQPLHVASPAAALRRAGHEVRCLDLSVQPWDPDALDWARAARSPVSTSRRCWPGRADWPAPAPSPGLASSPSSIFNAGTSTRRRATC